MLGIIDYIMSLMHRSTPLPLHSLKHWRPIKIDALGLVTLLGADNVNKSVGTLQRRRFTECLPLLAAFPGYALYNITDGIHTTELKGWFTRWLSAQRIRNSTTVFRWTVQPKSPDFLQVQYGAWAIGFLAVAPLLVCTCLIGDWYGVGNSLAIILSVLVRKFLLWQLRSGLNFDAVPEETSGLPLHNIDAEKRHPSVDELTRQLHRATSPPSATDEVKLFVTRADGKMVTIYAPRTILPTFFRDIRKPCPHWYHFMRWVGWAAFGAHIIVLGMSSLFTQIYTVVLLVFSTWALCHDFSLDSGRTYMHGHTTKDGTTSTLVIIPFTSRLQVQQENPTNIQDKRMYAYVRTKPDEKQEAMLQHWSLLPFSGVPWYDNYNQAKAEFSQYEAALSRGKSASTIAKSSSPNSPSTSTDSTRSPTLQGDP